MSKTTKLSTATEIVKTAVSKQAALAEIQSALGVTKANAFVYFTKATKALGTAPESVKTPRVEKVGKVNPLTETSPEKAAAKIAEIDAVIANLRAAGVKTTSPFAQLLGA